MGIKYSETGKKSSLNLKEVTIILSKLQSILGMLKGLDSIGWCAWSKNGKVTHKYYSPTHYGTGEDALKKTDFIEFQ